MAVWPYLANITKMWYLPNTCKRPYISSSTMRQTWKQVFCCGGVISWVLIHPFFLVTYHLKKEILLCQWGDATWTQEAQVFLLLEWKVGFWRFSRFWSSQCLSTKRTCNYQSCVHLKFSMCSHHVLNGFPTCFKVPNSSPQFVT